MLVESLEQAKIMDQIAALRIRIADLESAGEAENKIREHMGNAIGVLQCRLKATETASTDGLTAIRHQIAIYSQSLADCERRLNATNAALKAANDRLGSVIGRSIAISESVATIVQRLDRLEAAASPSPCQCDKPAKDATPVPLASYAPPGTPSPQAIVSNALLSSSTMGKDACDSLAKYVIAVLVQTYNLELR